MVAPVPYDRPPIQFGPSGQEATDPGRPYVGFDRHRVYSLHSLWQDSAYLLLGFPLALVAFVVMAALLALGGGLLITFVGVFVLTAAVFAARAFAIVQRGMLQRFLAVPSPRPMYRQAKGTAMRRAFSALGDPQSWLDILHAVVSFPVAVITWLVTVTWWTLTIGALSYPVWSTILRAEVRGGVHDLTDELGLSLWQGAAMYLALGLVAALLLPPLLRLMALLQGGLAQVLLCTRAEMQQRVTTLEESRASAQAAQTTELRRLERDIHDGPQQRLIRLQMDLARARRKMDSDPDGARDLLEAASNQTRDTLHELLNLSRGLAPPILVDRGLEAALRDRGLEAALRELCVRSTVPAELTVDILIPLPEEVETTIYFVATEALTNAAKHAGAGAAIIDVTSDGRTVTVTVADDGRGGAAPAPGGGLAGLSDRVAGLEGTLSVSSPPGGPTVVRAVLPCG